MRRTIVPAVAASLVLSPLLRNLDDNGTESMSSGSVTVRPVTAVEYNNMRKRRIVLPIEPHSLTFDEITYSIAMPQGIEGVSKIKDGYNPSTWKLQNTTSAREMALNVDFADIYKNSGLYWRNKTFVAELSKPSPGSKELHFPTHYAQPF